MRFKLTTHKKYFSTDDMQRLVGLGFEFFRIANQEEDWALLESKRIVPLELDSLEALMTFVERHGDVVIDRHMITLYDTPGA